MPRVCITVHGKNAQPYRFSLERKVVRLGRAADNDIIIDCPSVSSHHCEMKRIDGGYILKDLSSTNGIKLEGDKMEIIDLRNNLEILVGDAALEFELSTEEIDELAKEEHTPQQRSHLPEDKSARKKKVKKQDEEEPAAKSKPASRPITPTPVSRPAGQPPLVSAHGANGGANFAITLVFLFLALFAFYLGLASAHRSKYPKRDYPDSKGLWGDMFSPEPTLEKQKQAD